MTSVLVHFFLVPAGLVLPAASASLLGSSQRLGLRIGYDPAQAPVRSYSQMRPINTKTDEFCHKEFYKIVGAAQTNPQRQMVWKARPRRYLGASLLREGPHSLPGKL